jgi:hypothetical protein
LEQTKRELDEICKIVDYANIFCPIGGEITLQPTLPDVVRYAVKHKEHYGALRLVTNGTQKLSDDLLLAIEEVRGQLPVEFLISDYGSGLSVCKDDILTELNKCSIPVRVDKYWGDGQWFGGWVEFGDFEDRGYSNDELNAVWSECGEAQHGYVNVVNGRVTICCHASAAFTTGQTGFATDSIDLFDNALAVEDKRAALLKLSQRPMDICRRCNGLLTKTAKRYPAAEQLKN